MNKTAVKGLTQAHSASPRTFPMPKQENSNIVKGKIMGKMVTVKKAGRK